MLEPAFQLSGRAYAVRNPGSPVTAATVDLLEQQIGCPLPPQLRQYYLRWNGGLPFPLDVPEFSALAVRVRWAPGTPAVRTGPVAAVSAMLRLDSDINSLVEHWETFRTLMPPGWLPFQRDPGGSLFVIGTVDSNAGQVRFWSRDYQADQEAGEVPGQDNMAEVAPSFIDYLLALRDAEQLPGETEEGWIRRHYPD